MKKILLGSWYPLLALWLALGLIGALAGSCLHHPAQVVRYSAAFFTIWLVITVGVAGLYYLAWRILRLANDLSERG